MVRERSYFYFADLTFGFLLPWASICLPLSARVAFSVSELWQRGMNGKLKLNELVMSPDKLEGLDFVVKFETNTGTHFGQGHYMVR